VGEALTLKDPKVSIIIPTYNTEKYVLEAVHSCLAQTYRNFEIIIVDDGSTDKTLELLNYEFGKYQGVSITIISQKHSGVASALNRGIKLALGEYIHWLSADDALYPNALETMMKTIETHPRPSNCIFYSNYDYIDKHSKKINQPFIEPNYNDISIPELQQKLWDHYIGNGTTSMIHQSIFKRIGLYDESVPACEDYEFWIRAIILNGMRLYLIPEITAHYRIHSSQLTQTLGEKGGNIVRAIKQVVWSKMPEQQRKLFAKPC